MYNDRSRGNGYYENTYVKMYNLRNSRDIDGSPVEINKRFRGIKLPELTTVGNATSPKGFQSPEERGAFGKLNSIFNK